MTQAQSLKSFVVSELKYSDGRTAIREHNDGSVLAYYPNGRVAACTTVIKRGALLTTLLYFHDSDPLSSLLGVFDHEGFGHVQQKVKEKKCLVAGCSCVSFHRSTSTTTEAHSQLQHQCSDCQHRKDQHAIGKKFMNGVKGYKLFGENGHLLPPTQLLPTGETHANWSLPLELPMNPNLTFTFHSPSQLVVLFKVSETIQRKFHLPCPVRAAKPQTPVQQQQSWRSVLHADRDRLKVAGISQLLDSLDAAVPTSESLAASATLRQSATAMTRTHPHFFFSSATTGSTPTSSAGASSSSLSKTSALASTASASSSMMDALSPSTSLSPTTSGGSSSKSHRLKISLAALNRQTELDWSETLKKKQKKQKRMTEDDDESDMTRSAGHHHHPSSSSSSSSSSLMSSIRLEDVLKQAEERHPILKRSSVIRNNSGKYCIETPLPPSRLAVKKLPIISSESFDKTLQDAEYKDRLVCVFCMASWVPSCGFFEQSLEIMLGSSALPSKPSSTPSSLNSSSSSSASWESYCSLFKYDASDSRLLIDRYNLRTLPALLTFLNGRLVEALPFHGQLFSKHLHLPHVLLVEPDFLTQRVVEETFRRESIQWDLIIDPGSIAHVPLTTRRYGAVVLDGDLDGHVLATLLSRIKGPPGRDRPFTIVAQNNPAKSPAVPADVVIQKPIRSRELVGKVRRALEEHRPTDEQRRTARNQVIIEALQRSWELAQAGSFLPVSFKFPTK